MQHKKILFWTVLFAVMCASVIASAPNLQVSLLNQDPDPAKAGDVVEVRLRVQNLGDAEAKNVLFELVEEYPFSILDGEEQRQIIKSLPYFPETDNAKTLSYKLRVNRDATQGQYSIKFRHSLNNGGAWFMHTFSVDLTSREYAQIFSIDKMKIMPGKETNMTFTITNVGNAPLQNLMFFWKEPNGIILPVGTDNTRYIKYLDPGASVPLKYTVIASVNAKPDLYSLNLNLQYDAKSQDGSTFKETVTTTAGVFVGGETDFDVVFSESSAGQTSLSVANVGSNPAYSVTVRIPVQEGFNVRGSTDAIIGNLDKGDYTVVSFQIAQNSDRMTRTANDEKSASSTTDRQQMRQQFGQRNFSQGNKLKALIEYTDTTGVRHTIEKSIVIQFRSTDGTTATAGTQFSRNMHATTNKNWWGSITLWLIVVIISIVGFVLYKKPALRHSVAAKLANLVRRKR